MLGCEEELGRQNRLRLREAQALGGAGHEPGVGRQRRWWRGAGHLEQASVKGKRQIPFTKTTKTQ